MSLLGSIADKNRKGNKDGITTVIQSMIPSFAPCREVLLSKIRTIMDIVSRANVQIRFVCPTFFTSLETMHIQ